MEISSTFLKIAEKNREKYNGYKLFAETRQPIHLQHNQDIFYQNVPGIEDLYSNLNTQFCTWIYDANVKKNHPNLQSKNSSVQGKAKLVQNRNRQNNFSLETGNISSVQGPAIGVQSGDML